MFDGTSLNILLCVTICTRSSFSKVIVFDWLQRPKTHSISFSFNNNQYVLPSSGPQAKSLKITCFKFIQISREKALFFSLGKESHNQISSIGNFNHKPKANYDAEPTLFHQGTQKTMIMMAFNIEILVKFCYAGHI